MFDRLLKSKFYSKCKSVIKLGKARIETIQRRRNAMQKFLRDDIVDLLKNDLHLNAYGRVEGLIIEMNLSACYDLLEQFCNCILIHLSAMNLNEECPEECREAVATLIFAAARIADLPELRELRSIFTEKYRDSLESYVNKEFVEKLKLKPPTKDAKLQLMQDLSEENGMDWDPKTLEQQLYNQASSQPDFDDDEGDSEEIHITDKENWPDVLVAKTSFKKKQSSDYKSMQPPYRIKSKVNYMSETSSEASAESPRSFGSSSSSGGDKENRYWDDDPVREVKPKPKSVRRRRSKLNSDEAAKATELAAKENNMAKTSGHVHPNLPDYDDFVARFAALKGK